MKKKPKIVCEKCGEGLCYYSRNKSMKRTTCAVPKKEVEE